MNLNTGIKEDDAYGSQTNSVGSTDQVIKPFGTLHTRTAHQPLLNYKKHEGLQAYEMWELQYNMIYKYSLYANKCILYTADEVRYPLRLNVQFDDQHAKNVY